MPLGARRRRRTIAAVGGAQLAHAPKQLVAIDPRHSDVAHEHVGPKGRYSRERFCGRPDGQDAGTPPTQEHRHVQVTQGAWQARMP